MPSLRNPVGPLPSSIYWRRRVVVLVVLAAVLALAGWLVFGGGGGGTKSVSGKGTQPAKSITPGPTGSGNGGSSDGSPTTGAGKGGGKGGGKGAGSSGGSGATPGSGSTAGSQPVTVTAGGGAGTGGGTAGSGAGGSSAGSTGAGGSSGPGSSSVAANSAATMALPVCLASDLELSLTSTAPSYTAAQWPVFQLAITNTSGGACRTDLGATSAVAVVSTSGNPHVWSSGDCPANTAAQWYAIPGSGAPVTANFQWGRTTSARGCTPGSGGAAAGPGTYVVQVSLKGVTAQPSSQFRLAPFGS